MQPTSATTTQANPPAAPARYMRRCAYHVIMTQSPKTTQRAAQGGLQIPFRWRMHPSGKDATAHPPETRSVACYKRKRTALDFEQHHGYEGFGSGLATIAHRQLTRPPRQKGSAKLPGAERAASAALRVVRNAAERAIPAAAVRAVPVRTTATARETMAIATVVDHWCCSRRCRGWDHGHVDLDPDRREL